MKKYSIYKSTKEAHRLTKYDSGDKLLNYLHEGITLEDVNRPNEDIHCELLKSYTNKEVALDELNHCCGDVLFYSGSVFPCAYIEEYYLQEEEWDEENLIEYGDIIEFAPNKFHYDILPNCVRDAFCDETAHYCVPMDIVAYPHQTGLDDVFIKRVYALVDYADNDRVIVSVTDSVNPYGYDNSNYEPIISKEYFDIDDKVDVSDIVSEVSEYYKQQIEEERNEPDITDD